MRIKYTLYRVCPRCPVPPYGPPKWWEWMPNDCLSEAGHLYGPVGARAGTGSEAFNSKWPFGSLRCLCGSLPRSRRGPAAMDRGGVCGPGSLGYDPNEHTHRPRASPGLMKPPIKPIHVREASWRARRQRSFTNIARLARASHGPNGPAQLDLSSPDTH